MSKPLGKTVAARAWQAKYRKQHRTKALADSRRWYYANYDYATATAAAWRKKHPGIQPCQRAWRSTHPSAVRVGGIKAKHKRRAALAGTCYEPIDYAALYETFDGFCPLCNEFVAFDAVSWDHIVPLVRGGWHAKDNLQPTHAWCNSVKGERTNAWAKARILELKSAQK